jgi:hypothetical protein
MLNKLRGKSFYYWDHNNHNGASKIKSKSESRKNKNDCCFNHMIGLPTKDGIEKPLFDYEREIYFALLRPGYLNSYPSTNQFNIKPDNVLYPFKEKHLWIKKATGLGVTEFMLRLMAWLCVRNDDYRSAQMVVVTGPNQELAIKFIKRMKGLFLNKLGVTSIAKKLYSS